MAQSMQERSLPARILFSADEHRLRAGWRIIGQTILLVLLSLLVVLPAQALELFDQAEPAIGLLVTQAASLAAVCLSIFLARRILDRRSFTSLGLNLTRQAWRDLWIGFLIACIVLLLTYFLERLAGWLTVTDVAWQNTPPMEILLLLGIMLITFIATGFQEELYFRGYLMQNISDGLKMSWGVVLSSLVFGLAHLSNPNASLMGAIGVTLAGLLMAIGYLRTRQLWLPIGLHIGWNFIEGPLLGFPVSGISTFRLIHTRIEGPILFTGGDFGPEAGLVLLPGLFVGATLIFLLSKPYNQPLE